MAGTCERSAVARHRAYNSAMSPICWIPFVSLCLAANGVVSAAPAEGVADWASEPPRPTPGPAALERLRDGEVLVETVREDEKGGAARVQAVFRGNPREAWDTLQDCEANFLFVDGLKECELIESDTYRAVTRQVLKRSWYLPRATVVFETARQPYRWLRIRQLNGDFRDMNGYWRFDPGPDQAQFPEEFIVTHLVQVQPRTPAPRWLVRRMLKKDLPEALACLRWRVGASPGEAAARADRSGCPDRG